MAPSSPTTPQMPPGARFMEPRRASLSPSPLAMTFVRRMLLHLPSEVNEALAGVLAGGVEPCQGSTKKKAERRGTLGLSLIRRRRLAPRGLERKVGQGPRLALRGVTPCGRSRPAGLSGPP